MIYESVIKNSMVVAANGTVNSDIGITNGKIAAIDSNLDGKHVVNAEGLVALPGGIDSHVHISQPSGQVLRWLMILKQVLDLLLVGVTQRSFRFVFLNKVKLFAKPWQLTAKKLKVNA